jgi:hypothetical protein
MVNTAGNIVGRFGQLSLVNSLKFWRKIMVVKKVSTTPKIDIASAIQPVSAMELVISALFYGRSGTGKTTLAASFPGPILLIDFNEKGWDSVSNHDNLSLLKVTSWEMVEPLYWYLKKNLTKYKTIILDQTTSMQELCIKFKMEEEGKDFMSQRLWGVVGTEMRTWLINFRNLTDDGINVIFLAHHRTTNVEDKDDDDDQLDPNIGPQLMPSVSGTLQGAVKIIGNTFIRERYGPKNEETKKRPRFVEYCLRVGPHSVYATKMRTPKGNDVPMFMVDPTYEKLIELMRKGFNKPAVKVQPTVIKRKVQNA